MLVRSGLPVALAVASLGFLGIPGVAAASKVIAPPGNSGVSQYVEVVPGAGGSVPVGAGGSHGPVLSPSARRRLEAAGASGKALAAFAQRTGVTTAPDKSGRGVGNAAGRSHGSSHSAGSSSKGSPVLPAGVLAARNAHSSSGGGIGWGLPAALASILLAGLGLFFVRRRTA